MGESRFVIERMDPSRRTCLALRCPHCGGMFPAHAPLPELGHYVCFGAPQQVDERLFIDAMRTMTVILGGLIAGYCLRKSGRVAETWAGPVNRATLTWIQPTVICLALWAMKRPDARTLALPIFGIALYVALWPVGAALSRLMRLPRADAGPFTTATMFSNVGFTYGTFLAFAALGAEGAALGSLYCASFMPGVFTLGFFIGRRHSDSGHDGVLQALAALAKDGQTRNPILGIIAGLALNIADVPKLTESAFIIDIAMPAATAAFLLAIGLGLRLSSVKTYWRQCLVMHGAKFILSPVVGLGLAYLFGYWQAADHDALRVVFIQSAAPVAILGVMLADVFGLNRDLAGALWLTTNVTGVLLAPAILVIARML